MARQYVKEAEELRSSREPIRILFLVWKLAGGGAERQLIVLAKALAARGHEVMVGVYFEAGEYEIELASSPVKIISVQRAGFWDKGGSFRRILRTVRDFKPHVVHSYLDNAHLGAAGLRLVGADTRIVWGIRASQAELDEYGIPAKLMVPVLRFAARYVDKFIVNSHAGAADWARAGFPTERMVVIPNGIDLARFRPMPEAGAQMRQSWGIPETDKVIGMACRLDPMKDHATFARAAQLLAARRSDVSFVCVGEGFEPHRSAALAQLAAARLGPRLQWRGQCRDMPAFYGALDLLTSTSAFGEGCPNAPAEAMACGVPCVVTDVGDSREVVGDCGLVVRPRDPPALAEAWDRMLRDYDAARSLACRERVALHFSIERLTEATEKVLQEVVGADRLAASRET